MTESLLILLLVAATAAAAWFAYRTSQAQALAASAQVIKDERDRLRGELETQRQEVVRLSAELGAEKMAGEARKQAADEAAKALREQFTALAAQALDANQQRFLSLANETFEKHKQAAQGGVKEVLAPAQEQLAKLATSVDALEKARTQDKAALGEQVKHLMDVVGATNTTTTKLINVLRASPKARGRWGEQTLRNVLELAGLAPRVDFNEQTTTTDGEGGRLRPDVVINLPGGRCIAVDSKVALSGYLDAMDATDDESREAFLKKHAAEMRGQVKNLSSKEYWKHLPTADFVVLFVPGDNFLSAALERDPTLMDDAFAVNVVIMTPSLMVALAKSIAYGWRQEESAKNAQEIAELGRELYRRMAKMSQLLGDVGSSIEKSVASYNQLVGSIEARVFPQARKFKELGAGDAGVDVPLVEPVETAPRRLAPPPELELTPPPQGKKRGGGFLP
ncbi:MAG TPA: DNA recombination protein RmuC [Caulobacterales bacterium]|nr:DNA recombination protein RmuC [Caulobacterales bacterium]